MISLKTMFITLICAVIWVPILDAQPIQEGTDAGDFNTFRIENEYKLVVPAEKTEEVWNYLLNHLVSDKEFLKSLDPNLDSYWYNEYFEDTYFDTPEFQVFEKRGGIRYRIRENLDDPSQEKSGREVMQIKMSGIDNNSLNRGEIKFKVSHPAKIKRYDDSFPALGLVKRKQRDDFKQRLTELGINPYSLKEVLTIKQNRRSIYITRNGEQFISVRLDKDSSKKLWVEWQIVEIEPELNEIPYTEGSEADRKYMEDINQKIVDDIMQKFPDIKVDLTPKYCKAFEFFEKKIPFFHKLVVSGVLSL